MSISVNQFSLIHAAVSARKSPINGFLIVGISLFLSLAGGTGHAQQARAKPVGTEILWDTYGVPHIYARTLPALFYGFGWAQMKNHGNLILRLYGQARGRAAEYWGGEENLQRDKLVWTLGIPERAQAWMTQQTPEVRPCLEAFAAGMNDYAQAHPNELDPALKVVLPLTPADVLAHCQYSIQFTFVTGEALGMAQHWRGGAGSNAWAVSPKRSARGYALLLANPHLPWDDLFTWFEAQLEGPAVHGYGATLVGFPVLAIAFNEHLGWTHTVNTLDGADLYALTLAGDGYEWDGGQQKFQTTTMALKRKLTDGSLADEPLTIRRSVHGPVVAQHGQQALALRSVGWDTPNLAQQYLDMLRAKNLREFERAVKKLQMPMFTVMYADGDGHILHLFNGDVPVRPAGDYNWSGIVPGNTSRTLWTRVHRYEDLPRVVDPASGWLQNANDPPWTTTFPEALKPEDFPPYMAPRGMELRPQRSARLLMETNHLSLEEMIRLKHSTRAELADRILDDLLAAAQAQGSPDAKTAADVLRNWDRCTDTTSRGAVLFEAFVRKTRAHGGLRFAHEWEPKEPLTTPRGLADIAAALTALEEAASEVRQRYGALDVEWGAIHRLRRDGLDLPANGGPDELGIFRALWSNPADDGKLVGMGGDSFICAMEFSRPVRAQALLGYGNASQPGSKHRRDQLELSSRKELRPVWLGKKEIEAHLEADERL